MKTLTFLIPCYNVAHCVHHCIDTMLQDGILDDIEILAINDGSKDNTLEILRQYEAKYPTVIRVIDKANGGWGTAINLGIREAKGKYLKEVDADDWVSTDNLKEYIAFLKDNEIDYIATDYTEYFKAEDRYIRHSYHKEIYNSPMFLNEFWENHSKSWDFPIHAITYRTQVLRGNDIKVGDRYYGDIEYNLYPLPFVQTICVLPINITVYFRGSDEQSTSTVGYAKHYKDYAAMSQRITMYMLNLPTSINNNLYHFITETVCGTIDRVYYMMMSPIYVGKKEGIKKELICFDKWLKETDKKTYKQCGNKRRHGIATIKIWRITGFNIFSLLYNGNR